ncbi:hypothetical protein ACFP3U_06355 [Kitasatospora misakiensis]|uniref:Uncharacterized protein n=1 Tax=Kitasatospora misakiensis TaxID=67330 RepID=A0ABW0X068_9ACTN
MGQLTLDERYEATIGCRVSVQANLGSTTVRWSIGSGIPGGPLRPRAGDEAVPFTCHRCRRTMSITVESLAKARLKKRVYTAVGWLLLLSLLVTVPMLVHLGGQTVDENDDSATSVIGVLLLLAAVGFVLGFTFAAVGRKYQGVKKLRYVRPDGRGTVWVQGHRLF